MERKGQKRNDRHPTKEGKKHQNKKHLNDENVIIISTQHRYQQLNTLSHNFISPLPLTKNYIS